MRLSTYTLLLAAILVIAFISCKKSNVSSSPTTTTPLPNIAGAYAGTTHFSEHDLYVDSTGLRDIYIDTTYVDTVWMVDNPDKSGIIAYYKNYTSIKNYNLVIDTFKYNDSNYYSHYANDLDYEQFRQLSKDSLSALHSYLSGHGSYFYSHKNQFLGKRL